MTIDSTTHFLVMNSGDKEDSYQGRNDLILEEPLVVQSQAQEAPRHLVPVSLPYTDLQGRVLQLWKYGVKLIASMVNSYGELQVI
jgi:hypothetical protein